MSLPPSATRGAGELGNGELLLLLERALRRRLEAHSGSDSVKGGVPPRTLGCPFTIAKAL